jgi:hypothetical protein
VFEVAVKTKEVYEIHWEYKNGPHIDERVESFVTIQEVKTRIDEIQKQNHRVKHIIYKKIMTVDEVKKIGTRSVEKPAFPYGHTDDDFAVQVDAKV